MRFFTFIAKNLLRRKTRSLLTITGVAIPVLAVVCLVGVADGFRRSFAELYTEKGVDLIVIRAGRAERLTSFIDARTADDIRRLPGVTMVAGGLVDVVGFPDFNLTLVPIQGRAPDHFMNRDLKVLSGRKLEDRDARGAVLGRVLAGQLGKAVGDPVDVEGEAFTVIGVVDSFNVFENGSVFVLLSDLQRLMDRPNQITGFSVMVADSPDKGEVVKRVCADIEAFRDAKGKSLSLSAMPTHDFLGSTFELKSASAMAWVTSFVALVIGGIGMLNTMIMSVFERTREIGILRAIGWRKQRIVRMILGEAFLLSLLGAALGIGLGVAGVIGLSRLPDASLIVSGSVPLVAIAQGFGIAVLVGLLGGAYPAWRAARMAPTEAIRHE